MRDIKQRIANVSSAEQIIKAMDMVASTKLIKARAQLDGVRPIYSKMKGIVDELGCYEDTKEHIYYKERDVKSSLYIIITSDRGLSGSYNSNILAKTLEHMNQGKNEKILVVGSKGNDYLIKKKKNIIHKIIDIADSQVYYITEKIAQRLAEIYLSGEVEEVYIAYTHFESVLSNIPIVERLLPLESNSVRQDDISEKKYEPSIDEFIDRIVPTYLHMSLFRALSEAHTSEHAARMVNMDTAADNASELIDDLTRMYNRKRQAAITQELSEIVGSANILNKGGLDDS